MISVLPYIFAYVSKRTSPRPKFLTRFESDRNVFVNSHQKQAIHFKVEFRTVRTVSINQVSLVQLKTVSGPEDIKSGIT